MRFTAIALALVAGVSLEGQFADKKALTLEGVKKVAAAAAAEANKNNWKVAIAIVDAGGHLLYFERMDGAPLSAVELATGKARAAAVFGRPTKAYEDQLVGGRMAVLKIPGVMPFEGGVPIMAGAQVAGGIGVSGVTAPQDGQVARAGAAAVGTAP
ncbi:MAG: heme-binding protein [Acidobacteriota bacterium]